MQKSMLAALPSPAHLRGFSESNTASTFLAGTHSPEFPCFHPAVAGGRKPQLMRAQHLHYTSECFSCWTEASKDRNCPTGTCLPPQGDELRGQMSCCRVWAGGAESQLSRRWNWGVTRLAGPAGATRSSGQVLHFSPLLCSAGWTLAEGQSSSEQD